MCGVKTEANMEYTRQEEGKTKTFPIAESFSQMFLFSDSKLTTGVSLGQSRIIKAILRRF